MLSEMVEDKEKEIEESILSLQTKLQQKQVEMYAIHIAELIKNWDCIYGFYKEVVLQRKVLFPDPNRVCILEMLDDCEV